MAKAHESSMEAIERQRERRKAARLAAETATADPLLD